MGRLVPMCVWVTLRGYARGTGSTGGSVLDQTSLVAPLNPLGSHAYSVPPLSLLSTDSGACPFTQMHTQPTGMPPPSFTLWLPLLMHWARVYIHHVSLWPAGSPGAGPVLHRQGQPSTKASPDPLLQPADALCRPPSHHLPQCPHFTLSLLFQAVPELVSLCCISLSGSDSPLK